MLAVEIKVIGVVKTKEDFFNFKDFIARCNEVVPSDKTLSYLEPHYEDKFFSNFSTLAPWVI